MCGRSFINRRSFLEQAAAGASLASLASAWTGEVVRAEHIPATAASAPLTRVEPFQRRAPFGWQFGGVPPQGQGGAMELRWETSPRATEAARLRICVLDTREASTPVEVSLLGSGRVVGRFDLRWMAEFQVSEIPLDAADAASVVRRGVRLRQTGGTAPVWVLTGSGSGPVVPAPLRPHLLFDAPTDAMAEYYLRMDSLACVPERVKRFETTAVRD